MVRMLRRVYMGNLRCGIPWGLCCWYESTADKRCRVHEPCSSLLSHIEDFEISTFHVSVNQERRAGSPHSTNPQTVLNGPLQIVLKKKAVDDIMGGDDAWANVDKTQVLYVRVSFVSCT